MEINKRAHVDSAYLITRGAHYTLKNSFVFLCPVFQMPLYYRTILYILDYESTEPPSERTHKPPLIIMLILTQQQNATGVFLRAAARVSGAVLLVVTHLVIFVP